MAYGMLTKPSRLDRDVRRYQKRVESKAAKVKQTRAEQAAWSKRSAECCARDKGICRVCSCQTVKAFTGHPKLWGQAHHIIYRSAGGPDDLWNLAWICGACSSDEHAHRISITGTADALKVERV